MHSSLPKKQVLLERYLIIYLNRQLLFAKRAHSETDIADNAVSVSYAAVELAKKVFGKLKSKHAVIIGAGK